VGVSSGRAQLRPLTSLRFFAAVGVVVFHFGEPLVGHLPQVLQNIATSGYVGVSFFFVLSGFVLAYAHPDLDARDFNSVRSFLSARVARIYPAYLVSIILCAPFVARSIAATGNAGDASSRVVGSGLAALVLLQGWFPKSVGPWNFPAWSLSVELLLYLVFPYAIRRIRDANVRRALWVTFAAALATSLLRVTAQRQLAVSEQAALVARIVARFPLPLVHIPQFLFGVVLGAAFARQPARPGRRIGSATVLSVASALVTLIVLAESPHIPRPFLDGGLLAPLFGALIFVLACGGGPLASFLSWSWLVTLGDASYAVYILQVPVHDWAMRLHSFNQNKSVHVIAYMATLIAASLAVHKLVELPGRQLILGLSARLFSPARVGPRPARRRRAVPVRPVPGAGTIPAAVNPEDADRIRASGP
jgi:peptidoglycan/LPS O-acetylase OafA/YrhL